VDSVCFLSYCAWSARKKFDPRFTEIGDPQKVQLEAAGNIFTVSVGIRENLSAQELSNEKLQERKRGRFSQRVHIVRGACDIGSRKMQVTARRRCKGYVSRDGAEQITVSSYADTSHPGPGD
jgi:hypothetical protein